MDRVKVKGKNIAVTLCTPYVTKNLTTPLKEEIEKTNKIMELYFEGEFTKALHEIEGLNKKSHIHLQLIKSRCQQFIKDPPALWNGVFTMTVK